MKFSTLALFVSVALAASACTTTKTNLSENERTETAKRDILQVIHSHSDELADCVSLEPKEVEGKLILSFTVSPEEATQASLANDAYVSENQTNSETLGGCILGRLIRWEFPAVRKDLVVNYPVIITRAPTEEQRSVASSDTEALSVSEAKKEENEGLDWGMF